MNARDVVKLAAARVEDPQTKSWLELDEFGGWERQAQAMIDRTSEERERRKIADEVAADEMASRLALSALSAVLERARKVRGG